MPDPETTQQRTGEEVDDLQFSLPDCTVCDDGGDITADVGLYCMKCGSSWDNEGRSGERGDA